MNQIPTDQPELTQQQATTLLADGEISELLGYLPWGSNNTILVRVCDDTQEGLAVYKPRRGERPLWDFPTGTLCEREQAAFEVSELLGWNIVPPTVLRMGPHGEGSLQYFVPHDPDQNYFTLGERYRAQVQRIALFDHVINNADRKAGHCLVDQHDKLWAIDHGLSFHVQPKVRTVIWDFAGQRIPDPLLKSLQEFCVLLGGDPAPETLASLLSERELTALTHRVTRLSEVETFPHPGPGRTYPWPPV